MKNIENLRILGKGKTAQALKKRFEDARLFDDSDFDKCMEKIQNPSNSIIEEARDEIDLNERNTRTGMPLYKPKDISGAINDSEQNIRTLHNLKEKVEQELFEAVKTRSNRQINPFEV